MTKERAIHYQPPMPDDLYTACGREISYSYAWGQKSRAGPTRRTINWSQVTCKSCLRVKERQDNNKREIRR